MISSRPLVVALLSLSLLARRSHAQPAGMNVVHVRYGYFSETRPMLAACARGWLDLAHVETNTYYKVGCYPQASGNFVASRLDNLELDIAHIGSTPWAQGRSDFCSLQVDQTRTNSLLILLEHICYSYTLACLFSSTQNSRGERR
eukprot:scaffold5168_cov176-Amphora_coffeaeformis.AAC.7